MPSHGAPALFGCLEENGCEELASGSYQIFEGREFLIGRDYKTCNVILTDPTISNQHLQIYTISYIEHDHQRIFVYAKDLSTNGSYWRYKHGSYWKEFLIGKGNAVLLSDGDELRLCNGSSFVFRTIHRESPCPADASNISDEDAQLFSNLFRITDRKLGSGAYGGVWMAIDNFHQRQMACKIVKLDKSPQKRSGSPRFSGRFWREVDLLKDLSHPNILHVERVFFTEEKLYIISDLITGGDLMSYIERPWTNIEDTEACFIVYQVLKAVQHLHRQGICHRDLKPENILMSTPAPGAKVVLADFGHSTKFSRGKETRSRRMKTTSVGTDYYVAPEVRGKQKNTKGYTVASDMWSIGIITVLILTGEFVFDNSKNEYSSSLAILDAAANCDLEKLIQSALLQIVNNEAKDFVRSLLILDESSRFNVEQALEHEWFTDCNRKQDLQQMYEDAIRGWMPRRPLLDFKEDLAMFREADKSTLDSILMPPPAKPSSNRVLQPSLHPLEGGEPSSPFFLRKTQDDATKLAAMIGRKRGSIDLDYEECRLHDRVSREEASIFRSAKSYGQSVEKRRKLGH